MGADQHVAFSCKDMRAQEAFLSKHFGFKRARTFNAGTDGEFVMVRLGAACLELFQATDVGSASGGEQQIGFKHLAIEVDDLEKSIARLNEDGITTDAIIDCSNIHPGMRVCFFDDREGNRMELMQGYADE